MTTARLEIKYRKTDELIPYARNARTHSPAQVAQIAASIKEFGFNAPIAVDADNVVIYGHGRLLAAQKLGLEEVPTVLLDHLTDTQRRAFVIADNQIALNAGWDEELLRLELTDIKNEGFDLAIAGFDDSFLKGIEDIDLDNFLTDESPDGEKKKKIIKCPHCGQEIEV